MFRTLSAPINVVYKVFADCFQIVTIYANVGASHLHLDVLVTHSDVEQTQGRGVEKNKTCNVIYQEDLIANGVVF